MKTILSIIGATALLASAASDAPLSPAAVGIAEASNIDQVRLVCNEYGRCFRTRGPRYVQRYVDDGYYPRRSYNYYGGPGYYSGPAYGGYYGGGPPHWVCFWGRCWVNQRVWPPPGGAFFFSNRGGEGGQRGAVCAGRASFFFPA